MTPDGPMEFFALAGNLFGITFQFLAKRGMSVRSRKHSILQPDSYSKESS